jgi:hypothetical protein
VLQTSVPLAVKDLIEYVVPPDVYELVVPPELKTAFGIPPPDVSTQVSVPVFMIEARLYCEMVKVVPLRVTPPLAATVTTPAPKFVILITVPVA